MRQLAIALVVLAACSKDKPVETGKLCFAANSAEAFGDYLADKPTSIRFRKQVIAQPGAEVAIADAREGEVVELVRAGKVTDSFKLSFKKLGPDQCYFFRPYRDDKQPARWVLDSNREISRCHCFPIAPSAPADGGVQPPG